MLSDTDIKKIIKANRKVFATKEDLAKFATKEELVALEERLTKSFSDLQSAVDKFAKKADAYFQEMLVLAHKVERHEKWLHQIAEKLGVKLEY